MQENGAEHPSQQYTHWQRWEILRGLWDLEDRQAARTLLVKPPPLLHSVTEPLCLMAGSSSPHFPRRSVPSRKGFIIPQHLEVDYSATAKFTHYAWICLISTSSEPN